MATFPAKTNYAAGNVLTAAQMVDIGDQINALNGLSGGKNFLINGNMAIAQRGTSSVYLGAGSYRLDRWAPEGYQTANHQQVTTGSTTVPAYYALRAGSTSTAQDAGGSRISTAQQIESLYAQNLAGRTVTLSFWVKFSAASVANAGNWYAQFGSSTSVDPSVGVSTFSSYPNTVELVNGSLPTVWTKYSVTGTLPTDTRSIRLRFQFGNTFTTASVNSFYYDLTAVQLELGSIATEFSMAGGTLAGELAACQRYYWRNSSNFYNGPIYGNAFATSTTVGYTLLNHPTAMRIAPQSVDFSGLALLLPGTAFYSLSGVTIDSATTLTTAFSLTGLTGLTANRPYFLSNNNNTTGYIGLSAEL